MSPEVEESILGSILNELTNKRNSMEARKKEAQKMQRQINEMLARRYLMTVFEAECSGNDLDAAIHCAIIKGKKMLGVVELRRACRFDLVPLIEEHFFGDAGDMGDANTNRASTSTSPSMGEVGPEELATIAKDILLRNQLHILQIFVDNGLNFRKFLTERMLETLYQKVFFTC